MPSRSPFHDFLRFLERLGQPLYVLDEDRQIIYLNEACSRWLGLNAADLLGSTCRYQSGEIDPVPAAADSLCPPPEVFHGQRIQASILKWNSQNELDRRAADFIPLIGDNEDCIGVLAILNAESQVAANNGLGDNNAAELDEAASLHESVKRFRHEFIRWYHPDRLAGTSAGMARVRAQVKLAASANSAVLIVGALGSGRQHIARTIHANGNWSAGTFAPFACGELPLELLRSSVAAVNERCRHAAEEPPATLLLAEVDALPVELHQEFAQWLAAEPKNLRVLATAREPLTEIVLRGNFRGDLAELLSTLVIEIPPLAARREDIPLLAQMLLEDLNGESAKQLRGFTSEAIDRLLEYDWPGEIDELSSVVREVFNQAEGFEVTCDDLPKRLRLAAEASRFPRKPPEPIELEKFLARIELELIQRALRQAKGNKSQAAKLLGLNRPRLYRRMVQLGLEHAE